jgi:signal transduction histidine kinase
MDLGSEAGRTGSHVDGWFRALTRAMDLGVLFLRRDGQLEFANATARVLLGCATEQDLDRRWVELESTLDDALEAIPPGRTTATRVDLDIPAEREPLRLRLDLYRLDEDERPGYLVLIKNRRLLDALETDLRLATQSRAMARLLVTMAHDLKAPLNAMVINLELLQSTVEGKGAGRAGIRERQRRYVTLLKEELSRLNRSLHTLLTQTARPSETPQRFDLRELIQEVDTLLRSEAALQRVTLDIRLPEHAILLNGHRDRLRQAILNLVINALEAMPDGGRLEIRVQVQATQAKIAIRDTGPGIPLELLPRIGTMHFTTRSTGTGIGLYVARSVVEAYGGTIDIDTEVGRGTCFQITLPIPFGEI